MLNWSVKVVLVPGELFANWIVPGELTVTPEGRLVTVILNDVVGLVVILASLILFVRSNVSVIIDPGSPRGGVATSLATCEIRMTCCARAVEKGKPTAIARIAPSNSRVIVSLCRTM